MAEEPQTPERQVRRLYEDAEQRTAAAMEQLVGRQAFGEILARVTENVMALTRIGSDTLDLAVRNMRLAGRKDLVRLGRQLARTEDKLELVLQQVERLEAQLEQSSPSDGSSGSSSSGNRGSGSRSSGSRSSGSRSSGSRSSGSRSSGTRSSGTRSSGSRSSGSRSSSGNSSSSRRRSGSRGSSGSGSRS